MKQVLYTLLLLVLGFSSCTNEISKDTHVLSELSGDELKIIAEIYLKPDAFKSMKPVFEKLIAGSQAEEGCIYYDLHIDIADTTNTRFVMLETWKDQEAIDAHNESEHYKNFSRVGKDYIDSTKVTIVKVSK